MDIVGEATTRIQNLTPNGYVLDPETLTFTRVAEYPVITGQGVFVNLTSGNQIGPLPLDTEVSVPVWE